MGDLTVEVEHDDFERSTVKIGLTEREGRFIVSKGDEVYAFASAEDAEHFQKIWLLEIETRDHFERQERRLAVRREFTRCVVETMEGLIERGFFDKAIRIGRLLES